MLKIKDRSSNLLFRRKKFQALIIGLALFSFPTSANALPGWGFQQTKNWLQNHPFLQPPKDNMGFGYTFGSFRELQDNKFVYAIYSVDTEQRGAGWHPTKINNVQIYVTQQQSDQLENGPTGPNLKVWARNSEQTATLLKSLFPSLNVDSDFKNSKLVYKTTVYAEYYFEGSLEKIETRLSSAPHKLGEINLFQGQQYAYQITSDGASFSIINKNKLGTFIDILKQNEKIVNEFFERQKRYLPAEIKL